MQSWYACWIHYVQFITIFCDRKYNYNAPIIILYENITTNYELIPYEYGFHHLEYDVLKHLWEKF